MDLGFTPQFRRQFKKLPKELQNEVLEKIELFQDIDQHQTLKVHKLQGRLEGRWSFSVNYRYRIIFTWETRDRAAILLAVGDHSIYR